MPAFLVAFLVEFPIELRIPNAATAKVLSKVDRGEDVETSTIINHQS